jgi:hypothetical protein
MEGILITSGLGLLEFRSLRIKSKKEEKENI